jgi:hypothetical protein
MTAVPGKVTGKLLTTQAGREWGRSILPDLHRSAGTPASRPLQLPALAWHGSDHRSGVLAGWLLCRAPGTAGLKIRIQERAPPSWPGADVFAAFLKAVQ